MELSAMQQTTARLRKTFHYPTDNDSDSSLPDVLDETEQESLIQALALENATRNAQFARLLLLLPLLSAPLYLPSLITPRTALPALLSISSLLCTAYLLHVLPAGYTGLVARAGEGPVMRYLPRLNLALALLLAVLGMVRGGEVWWGFEWLPGAVYGVVLVAKGMMGSVDPEAELTALRYEFKGA